MQAYGRKKGHTHIEGHQECGICHPVQKNKVKRARRTNKQAISEGSEPVSEPSDEPDGNIHP